MRRSISLTARVLSASALAALFSITVLAQTSSTNTDSNNNGLAEFMGMQRLMGGPVGGPVGSPPADANGFGFYSVSAFTGYVVVPGYLTPDPTGNYQLQNKGYSLSGVSASMGWAKRIGDKSRIYLMYSPVITVPYYGSGTRLMPALDLRYVTSLNSRWTLNLGLFANYGDFQQYAFEPARITQMAQVPASLDDFLNGVNGGQFSNNEIAALLTGAPILEAPARVSLYGNLNLTATGQVSLSYRMSPRMTLSFNANAYRNQTVATSGDRLQTPIAPSATGASTGVTFGYRITERDNFTASVNVQETVSRVSDYEYVTANLGYSRRVGQRLSFNVNGGGGEPIQRRLAIAGVGRTKNYTAGAGMSVQITSNQSASLSYGRTFVDNYGLGLISTQSGTAGWSYSRPGRGWGASASVSYFKADQNVSRGVDGMFASAGISKQISPRQGLSMQAFYSKTNSNITDQAIAPTALLSNQEGVRIMYTWYPKVSHSWYPKIGGNGSGKDVDIN